MTVTCPVCGAADRIQKVSAVVAAGTTSGEFAGPSVGVTRREGRWGGIATYTTLRGSSATYLAGCLRPPARPGISRIYQDSTAFWTAVVFSLLAFGLLLYAGVAVRGALGWGMAIVAGGGMLLLVPAVLARESRTRAYELQLASWKRAMERWDRLYYCHRDDVVFEPGGRPFGPHELDYRLREGQTEALRPETEETA
jgi:hypothetical protein